MLTSGGGGGGGTHEDVGLILYARSGGFSGSCCCDFAFWSIGAGGGTFGGFGAGASCYFWADGRCLAAWISM